MHSTMGILFRSQTSTASSEQTFYNAGSEGRREGGVEAACGVALAGCSHTKNHDPNASSAKNKMLTTRTREQTVLPGYSSLASPPRSRRDYVRRQSHIVNRQKTSIGRYVRRGIMFVPCCVVSGSIAHRTAVQIQITVSANRNSEGRPAKYGLTGERSEENIRSKH
jgi:hypothetical protein